MSELIEVLPNKLIRAIEDKMHSEPLLLAEQLYSAKEQIADLEEDVRELEAEVEREQKHFNNANCLISEHAERVQQLEEALRGCVAYIQGCAARNEVSWALLAENQVLIKAMRALGDLPQQDQLQPKDVYDQ